MPDPGGAVQRQFHVIETAMGPELALARHLVLVELEVEIQQRFEMRLTDQRSSISGLFLQVARDARRVDWQRHPVHPYAMRRDVLSGDHRRARRHADDILAMRSRITDSITGPAVDDRGAGNLATVASE